MAIVRAVKSGNWSDTTLWNTGALPTSADDVYSNTFTVTVDISPTVLSISNASATGVSAGGSLILSNGITLTCTGNGVLPGVASSSLITSSLTTGQVASIVSNLTAAAASSAIGISNIGAGTINFTGSLSGNSSIAGATPIGISNSSSGTINVTGNLLATSIHTTCQLILNSGPGSVNVTGSVTAGNHPPIVNSSSGVITVVGTLTSSNTQPAITSTSINGTLYLSGPFVTSSNGVNPVYAQRWLWQAASPSTYYQVRTISSLALRPLYTAESVGGNPATANVRSGTVYGPNNELTGTCAVPGASSVLSGVPIDASTGTATISAASIRSALGLASANLDTQLAAIPTTAAPTAAAIRTEMDANSTKLANLDATVSSRSTYAGADTSGTTTLLSRLTSGRASAIDNLDATVSSRLPASGYTAPPSASSIASAVWSAVTRTITGGTVDTATTLTNAPTVPSVAQITAGVWGQAASGLTGAGTIGAQLATNLDATVSSRLAAASYTAAPTTSAIRTELSVELARIDAAISTRSTYSGADTSGTTTLLGRLTSGRASGLDNLDASVSSRLAASGYTAPPSVADIVAGVWTAATRTLTTAIDNSATIAAAVWAYASGRTITGGTVDSVANAQPINSAAIAQAVRSELTPELARVANSATTQEVAEIVQDAIQP